MIQGLSFEVEGQRHEARVCTCLRALRNFPTIRVHKLEESPEEDLPPSPSTKEPKRRRLLQTLNPKPLTLDPKP